MNNLFFDTEFTGLHQKTTLISIGIVSDTGKTFYAELTDYDKTQIDDWLQVNVVGNLLNKTNDGEQWAYDNRFVVGDTAQVKEELIKWLEQFEGVRMWSDCLSYDWVLFCQLFGHAFKIPERVYYIPFDICPLLLEQVGNADINREEFAGEFEVPDFLLNKKHNALWDAYVIRECFEKLHPEQNPELCDARDDQRNSKDH